MKIARNEITPALRALQFGLESPANIVAVANAAKMVIINRTLHEKLSLDRQPFRPYSTDVYYAPVDKRPPGYPKPSGGRTQRESHYTHKTTSYGSLSTLRGGKKLKTVAYDGGYGEYKAALGLGSAPQLSVSNRMLSDIQVRFTTARSALLFFGNRLSAAKAHGLHFGKFPFFGLHISEQAGLYRVLANQLAMIRGVKR
jgi:hypothetical protein